MSASQEDIDKLCMLGTPPIGPQGRGDAGSQDRGDRRPERATRDSRLDQVGQPVAIDARVSRKYKQASR
jgi:hypothetical protein